MICGVITTLDAQLPLCAFDSFIFKNDQHFIRTMSVFFSHYSKCTRKEARNWIGF